MSPPTTPDSGSPAPNRNKGHTRPDTPTVYLDPGHSTTQPNEGNNAADSATDLAPTSEADAHKDNIPLMSAQALSIVSSKSLDLGSAEAADAEPQDAEPQIDAPEAPVADLPPRAFRSFFIRKLHPHPEACKLIWAFMLSCLALAGIILLVMFTGDRDSDGRGQSHDGYPLDPEAAVIVKRNEPPLCDPTHELCPLIVRRCGDDEEFSICF